MHPFKSWFCWSCGASNSGEAPTCRRCYTTRSAAKASHLKTGMLANGALLLAAFTIGYAVMMHLTLMILLSIPTPR